MKNNANSCYTITNSVSGSKRFIMHPVANT